MSPSEGWEMTTDPGCRGDVVLLSGNKWHPDNNYSKNTLLNHLAAQKPDKQTVLSPNIPDK